MISNALLRFYCLTFDFTIKRQHLCFSLICYLPTYKLFKAPRMSHIKDMVSFERPAVVIPALPTMPPSTVLPMTTNSIPSTNTTVNSTSTTDVTDLTTTSLAPQIRKILAQLQNSKIIQNKSDYDKLLVRLKRDFHTTIAAPRVIYPKCQKL